MPTPSARRSRIAQETNICINGVESARKSIVQGSQNATADTAIMDMQLRSLGARWLLSYQNIKKRAMEVSISRPTHLAIDESTVKFTIITMTAVIKTRVNQT